MYTLVFRVSLLLNAAIMYLSEAIFELGLARDPTKVGRACILSALYRYVIDLTVSLTNAVARGVTNFISEMSKESTTLSEDYYVILEDVESMQLVE
ncbi:hypothetical protein TELCIR_07272 [Teladorsagia circumcincta]|uniref:ABC transmembrane type-1 domain-containing protein n=1 Tax=Teladorsagia circumcincta TaxID=45464 RepID=A0A2G9UL31_TELCI|nr:hypothetical protein TELCIR_07272 [Teladorsagia circumcincta]